MHTFCTFFDSRYLSRGIAMYESLARHLPRFELFVLAFDEPCRQTLERMGLPGLKVISLAQFEDPELLAAKQNRNWIEYLWTCTPSVVLHVLERIGRERCTYLDADLYFFASPQPLLDEIGDAAALITEHRYTPRYDQTATSGRFCVQFMTFLRDDDGLRILGWWRAACLESCELDPEQGKCGDQKYLDDWPTRFPRVHVLEHLGGGVAPWNVQQYRLSPVADGVRGEEVTGGRGFQLVFYHFHGLRISVRGSVFLTGSMYELGKDAVDLLYRPYVRSLEAARRRVAASGAAFDPHGSVADPRSRLRANLGVLKRRLRRALGAGDTGKVNFNVRYDLEQLVR